MGKTQRRASSLLKEGARLKKASDRRESGRSKIREKNTAYRSQNKLSTDPSLGKL